MTTEKRAALAGVSRFSDATGTNLISRTASSFDALGRITQISHLNSVDSIVADYQFDFDLASQMIQQIINGDVSDYAYDDVGQLTGATNVARADEAYTYDDNGNRIDGSNVIGTNNQLLSDGTFDYTYDAEGNLIRRTEIATGEYTEYEFDHRNRMVAATTFSSGGIILSESSYTYDVFDRMIARTVDRDGAGSEAAETTYTVYDGENAWADFDDAGQVIARYLFGEGLDSNIARWRPGEGTAWYLTDHLGSVRDITDASGAVINHIEYDSFGNILSESNSLMGDRFKFTGREWMSELGLYYYRARFYDPVSGRFISQDPIGFSAGDANLQRYVGNSPLTSTDPTGNISAVAYGKALEFDLRVANSVTTGTLSYVCGYLGARFRGLDSPNSVAAKQAVLGAALGYALHHSATAARAAVFFSISAAIGTVRDIAAGKLDASAFVVDTVCFTAAGLTGKAAANRLAPKGLFKNGPRNGDGSN